MWRALRDLLSGAQAIIELRDRFERIERNAAALELEFVSLLDQVKRLMGRVAKRAAVDNPAEAPTENLTREERKTALRRTFRKSV